MRDANSSPSAGLGFLARFYWMFLGDALLCYVLIALWHEDPAMPSVLDLLYAGVLTSLVAVRYGDIRFLGGQTGDGRPAEMAHWRRYSVAVVCVAAAGWILVRWLA